MDVLCWWVFRPRFEGCTWMFCAGGYFVHVLRAVHGYFALVEYFVHVLRVVRGCFALKEYFVHVLRVVCGYFVLVEFSSTV